MKFSKKKEKVLITGVTGQDGAYLSLALLNKGYDVFGTLRRGGSPKTERLKSLNILEKINLSTLELTELSQVIEVLSKVKPDYIYNLAAQSFVMDSFTHPIITTQVNYLGVLNLLESIRLLKLDTKLLQPSSSDMYGEQNLELVNEDTPFNPLSPYALAKYAAHSAVKIYRRTHGIQAVGGIFFNHESELRGREFVTRKITFSLAQIKQGSDKVIQLGNLSALRDWGYAKDFIEAMQLIIENQKLDEFVVATSKLHSVRKFFELAARTMGFDPVFEGEGLSEKCYDRRTNKILCQVDEKLFRSVDVNAIRGDYGKINRETGWKPSTSFEKLVELMAIYDLKQPIKTNNLI